MDERKGFFTEDQEKQLDEFIKEEGLIEALDGTAIKLADNILLNALRKKLIVKSPQTVEMIDTVIDEIFAALK